MRYPSQQNEYIASYSLQSQPVIEGCHSSFVTKKLLTMLRVVLLSTCPLFAASQSVLAGSTNPTDDLPSVRLDPIVVTATKTDKYLSDSPVPVVVISSKQLKENQAHTLKEALQLLPGVVFKQVHGKSGYQIMMQGLSSEQVLVLIDGMPITASTGSTVNLNQYLNVAVEQIEVIRGASSAQYGSSAMGGVINVISKKLDSSDKPYSAHVNAEVATNTKQNPSNKQLDANKTYLEASLDARLDKEGHWQTRISASQLQDDGLSLDQDKWARLKDDSKQTQVSARLQFQPEAGNSDRQAWIEATHYQEEDKSRFNRRVAQNILQQQKLEEVTKRRLSIGFNHKFDNDSASNISNNHNVNNKSSSDTNTNDKNFNNNDLDFNSKIVGGNIQGKLFYEDYDSASDSYSITPRGKVPSVDRDANLSTKVAQLQYDFPQLYLDKNNVHYLQIGGQWQQDNLSQTNNGKNELTEDKVKRDVAELYLQDDWLIGKNWELLTGVRYQEDSDFGGHIAPKVSLKYNHLSDNGNEHTFRGSVGQGYRVPNLKERHFVFDHSVYGYMVKGNPDLEPETSSSYQLSYQGDINNTVQITANLYYNKVKDLIQTDSENPLIKNRIAIYQYKNIDSASTYGGDLGVTWAVNEQNQLQANYTYTHTQNDKTEEQLLNRPEHQVMIALNSNPSEKINLINRLTYESKHLVNSKNQQYSPNWWTWDSKLNYKISPKFTMYVGVNNLFNRQRNINHPNDQSPIDNRQWLIGANIDF